MRAWECSFPVGRLTRLAGPRACQQLGPAPDVAAFGKKTQVRGVMAGRRVDDPDLVLAKIEP